MEPNYCCFACRDTLVQSFSCSCYILSWGGTTQHFLSFSVCLLHVLPSSTPSNTDSVRAQTRHELGKEWILYPTARDHYREHFKVFCHLFLPSFYHVTCPSTETQMSLFLRFAWQNYRQQIVLHCFQKLMPLLAGQYRSCPDCPGFYSSYCISEKSVPVLFWSFSSKPSYRFQSNILSKYPDSQMISEFSVIFINCMFKATLKYSYWFWYLTCYC